MQNIPHDISILFEDEHMLIVDKPAGITVNRADTTRAEITIQDWVERKLSLNPIEKQDEENVFYQRGGIVHRIDKETSGILLIAKNPEAFVELQRQFKERLVKKTYVALAHGFVAPATGEIHVPVGRLPWNRKQFGVIAGGREAYTSYKVLEKGILYGKGLKEQVTFVELYPKTGRTHQIRVHLKYLGYPIFADFLYAGRKTQRNDRKLLSRVFLHASKIAFFHPKTQELITFESKLPNELQLVLNEVKKGEEL